MKVVITNLKEYVNFINKNIKVKRKYLGKLDMGFYQILVKDRIRKKVRGQRFRVKVTNTDNCRHSNIANFQITTVKNDVVFVKFTENRKKELTGFDRFFKQFIASKRLNTN